MQGTCPNGLIQVYVILWDRAILFEFKYQLRFFFYVHIHRSLSHSIRTVMFGRVNVDVDSQRFWELLGSRTFTSRTFFFCAILSSPPSCSFLTREVEKEKGHGNIQKGKRGRGRVVRNPISGPVGLYMNGGNVGKEDGSKVSGFCNRDRRGYEGWIAGPMWRLLNLTDFTQPSLFPLAPNCTVS